MANNESATPQHMRGPAEVIAMVHETVRVAGRLDYLVGSAAISPFMPWNKTSIEDLDAILETSLRGRWVITREAGRQKREQEHGGAIVSVRSISAHVGAPGQTAYSAAKGGISMSAETLGTVLGDHGSRINAVEPGAIDTKMAAPLNEDAVALKYYQDRIALHRIGQPEELAGTIAYRISDEASCVTSATPSVDASLIVNAGP